MLRSVIVWFCLCSICCADTASYKAEVAARKERARALAMQRGLARHTRVQTKKNAQHTYQYFYYNPWIAYPKYYYNPWIMYPRYY